MDRVLPKLTYKWLRPIESESNFFSVGDPSEWKCFHVKGHSCENVWYFVIIRDSMKAICIAL